MKKWSSISVRLPLLISLLLVSVIGIASWEAYRHVETAVLVAAEDRLRVAAGEVASVLSLSLAALGNAGESAASDGAVQQHVLSPTEGSGATAEARLRQLLGPAAAQATATVELWSAAGNRLVAVGGPSATIGPPGPPPSALGMTPLRAEGGLLRYDYVTPIPGSGTAPAGWIVQKRVLASAQTGALLARFVGEDATLAVANADGSLWTDLAGATPSPLIEGPLAPGFLRYALPDGSRRAASGVEIASTPLIAWVSLPEDDVLAPVRTFVGRAMTTALLLVVLGTVGAWFLSRGITEPLVRLADAAAGVSAGDYSRRVTPTRSDEVGQLTEAFNAMAEKVQEQHKELEDQVADRTAKLRLAYRKLVDAQHELVRKEKLATLGQLASGVGHELRNPLGVMTNAVYFLEMVLTDSPSTVREYLGILKSQIGLSEKIVGDLLDFARVKPPRLETVPVGDLVDAQVPRLGLRNGLVISKELPPDLPPVVVDTTQIGQVLLNLLMNGAQAMGEEGGTLHIRARAFDENVELSVQDEGPGVAPENIEKIFEPLFTTKARGIGLGLAVSRALAEKNRGTISLRSPAGEGATFILTLPTTPLPTAAGDAA